MPKQEDRWHEWILAAVLLGLIGFLLILFVYPLIESTLWQAVVLAIGTAFIAAGLVEGAFGLTFKRRLAQDVFKTAFGYILHEKLRNEVNWLYSLHFLAVEYTCRFEFEPVQGDNTKVLVRERLARTIENITDKSQEFLLDYGVRSYRGGRIVEYQFTGSGADGVWSIANEKLTTLDTTERAGTQVIAPGKKVADKIKRREDLKVTVSPGETFSVVHVAEEEAHLNGESYSFSATAALNPIVEVSVAAELSDLIECQPHFANRNQGELQPQAEGRYRMNGTLLPYQGVRLRWWRKSGGVRDEGKEGAEAP